MQIDNELFNVPTYELEMYKAAIFVWLAGTPQLAADTVLRPLQEIFDVIIHIAWATVPFSTGILSCSTDPPHGKLTVRALHPRR